MKNSLFAAELLRRLGAYADKELLGYGVEQGHGVLTIDESEALNDAVKKIIVATGLSDFVKVEHCEATELYPAMTYFLFDFKKMDAVPQKRQ